MEREIYEVDYVPIVKYIFSFFSGNYLHDSSSLCPTIYKGELYHAQSTTIYYQRQSYSAAPYATCSSV